MVTRHIPTTESRCLSSIAVSTTRINELSPEEERTRSSNSLSGTWKAKVDFRCRVRWYPNTLTLGQSRGPASLRDYFPYSRYGLARS